jgi:cyclic di-GMP phosphodiesterase
MRILTVDDDEIALEMLNMALWESGHETISARDGSEALRLLGEEQPRMMITDWEMPGMSGLDICRAIREQGSHQYIYAMLLTSHGGGEGVVEGMSAGADDFLVKPFNPAELAVRVRAGERVLAMETRDVAIFAMARLAESRDPETGQHLERVRTFAQLLATKIGKANRPGYEVDGAFIQLIYQTTPLHDIGKIGIPDGILLKPGRLSDREFDIMKSHTTLGADTLQAALDEYPEAAFLTMARDIALRHHERFDGTGYPDGLAGENIPLCARIVALADVYDALTSKRVYKNAFGHEVARSIISDEAGSHFDPVVAEAFLSEDERFRETQHQFSEALVA